MRRAKLNSFERSLRKFQALTQFCFNVLAFFVLASISTRKAQTTEIPFHVRMSRNILRIPVRLLFFFSRKIAHSIFVFPLICGRGLNVNTRTIRGEYKSKQAMDWRCARNIRLSTICPEFETRTRRHRWIEFLCSLLSYSALRGFSLCTPVCTFPKSHNFNLYLT